MAQWSRQCLVCGDSEKPKLFLVSSTVNCATRVDPRPTLCFVCTNVYLFSVS